jgi:hypothetical protein
MIGLRSPLHRFALGAALAMVPLFALWWLSADVLTAALRPATAWVVEQLLPIAAIDARPGQGWAVKTSLKIVAAPGSPQFGHSASFDMANYYCRRLTLSWPALLALMLAPPRPRYLILRIIVAVAALSLLFALSVSAVAFCRVTALANHIAVPACDTGVPPFLVAAPRYGPVAFFAARFGYYGALFFLPFVAPAILWLALNPLARTLFLDFGASRGSESQGRRSEAQPPQSTP